MLARVVAAQIASSNKITSAAISNARPLRLGDGVRRGLIGPLGGGHPVLIVVLLAAGGRERAVLALPLGAAGVFPVLVVGRAGAAGAWPVLVVLLVNASAAIAPATAPAAPAAATLPVLPLGLEGGVVTGVGGGGACVAVSSIAEGGNIFVFFSVPLGRAPLGG